MFSSLGRTVKTLRLGGGALATLGDEQFGASSLILLDPDVLLPSQQGVTHLAHGSLDFGVHADDKFLRDIPHGSQVESSQVAGITGAIIGHEYGCLVEKI